MRRNHVTHRKPLRTIGLSWQSEKVIVEEDEIVGAADFFNLSGLVHGFTPPSILARVFAALHVHHEPKAKTDGVVHQLTAPQADTPALPINTTIPFIVMASVL